jgi:hypothetical protein
MTKPLHTTSVNLVRMLRLLAVASLATLTLLLVCGTARADLFESVGIDLNQAPPMNPDGTSKVNPDGTFVYPGFTRQAGGHPDLVVSFKVPLRADGINPIEGVRNFEVELPPGFVGNPNAPAACRPEFLTHEGGPRCSRPEQVGVAEIEAQGAAEETLYVPLFNISHGPNVPARFGFAFNAVTAMITPRVSPADVPGGYSITSGSISISQTEALKSVRLTLWGVPADPSHNSLRFNGGAALEAPFEHPQTSLTSPEHARVPFLSASTSCSEAPVPFFSRGDSWEHPGVFDEREISLDTKGTPLTVENCDKLPFAPIASAQTSSRGTESPTGLNVEINVPQPQDPDGFATAHVRKVKMTLPAGVSVSPSAASGLGACSLAQIGLGSNEAPSCPNSSRLGKVKIKTPLLEEELEGDVLLAKQNENPFNSLLALYIAVKGPGFWLKLPGRVELDPQTGQLTTVFDNNPQLPFETLTLALNGGPKAALVTPGTCGTYQAQVEFVSWASAAPVAQAIPMTFNEGCAAGGFSPKLNAGSVDSHAGSYAPFNLQVTRVDGEQNLSRIEATLPPGLLAKLAGIPLCGDAPAATGNCPAASQVGTTTVGAGPGSLPAYVPEVGKAPTAVYLAGPYKGAPYSLVVKVPAQAGPFDLGTVTVRNALFVDPTTTQVTAKSDPLPQILQGIPISYRDVRVEANRPEFTLNPTNCKQMVVTSTLTSSGGRTASPSSPFAATGCGELDFGPSLQLAMTGQTKRAGNPALSATLKAPKGQANIASTTVILPKTVFIDQRHVNGPCTRVQFNADACPATSVLGTATAWSPLLDQLLTGPVYFRSNGGERRLPDLVADLNGQIHVVLVGFIDSKKVGKETSLVRTRFASVPDAPVSKFVIKLKGGKKSLIQNSANLCKAQPKAEVKMGGQNGKTHDFKQPIHVSCGKKSKGKKAAKH